VPATVDQIDPSQCSMVSPVATQSVLVVQDTPARNWPGLEMIDHAVPFHCSTSDDGVAPLVESPTAMQLAIAVHETADRLV
jgi:hypothetical protein